MAVRQFAHSRRILQKSVGDMGEPIGIGPIGSPEAALNRQRIAHRLGHRTVGQHGGGLIGLDQRAQVFKRFARSQQVPLAIMHRHRKPDRPPRRDGPLQRTFGLREGGERFQQDEINLRGQKLRDLCHLWGGLIDRQHHVVTVAGDQRADGPCDTPRSMGRARLNGRRNCRVMQLGKPVIKAKADQTIMVDRIGVRGRNRGTGGEIVVMHRPDQIRVIDHDPRGPQVRGLVARTVDEFLSHAAVQQRNPCHCAPPNAGLLPCTRCKGAGGRCEQRLARVVKDPCQNRRKLAHIGLGKGGFGIAVEVKDPQKRARAVPDRQHQFRPGGRGAGDVIRKGFDIRHQLHFARARSRTANPARERDHQTAVPALIRPDLQ